MIASQLIGLEVYNIADLSQINLLFTIQVGGVCFSLNVNPVHEIIFFANGIRGLFFKTTPLNVDNMPNFFNSHQSLKTFQLNFGNSVKLSISPTSEYILAALDKIYLYKFDFMLKSLKLENSLSFSPYSSIRQLEFSSVY